jgi:hypothetical protein
MSTAKDVPIVIRDGAVSKRQKVKMELREKFNERNKQEKVS